MQTKPKYKFYATLLDSFQYYLDNDSDNAFHDFIDTINRVKTVGEAAFKGTALNNVVDYLNEGKPVSGIPTDKKGNYLATAEGVQFSFKPEVVDELASIVKGSSQQVYISAILPTPKGDVELYGYIDYVLMSTTIDLKSTSNYTFPKYLEKWQKHVYPYCLNERGIFVDSFAYLVTDFNHIYIEDYAYVAAKTRIELTVICGRLIDFIETHRKLIVNQKIFGLV